MTEHTDINASFQTVRLFIRAELSPNGKTFAHIYHYAISTEYSIVLAIHYLVIIMINVNNSNFQKCRHARSTNAWLVKANTKNNCFWSKITNLEPADVECRKYSFGGME